MEFVFGPSFSRRILRITFLTFTPLSILSLPAHKDAWQGNWEDQQEISKFRRRVLRRDQYRCRGCDRDGREVTLAVHRINPAAKTEQEMLTLCRECFGIANQKIVATRIPEFLRKLWAVLHSPKIGPPSSDQKPLSGVMV